MNKIILHERVNGNEPQIQQKKFCNTWTIKRRIQDREIKTGITEQNKEVIK